MKLYLIFAVALASLNACTAQKMSPKKPLLNSVKPKKNADNAANATLPGEMSYTVHLNEGQTIFLRDKQMNISFNKVLQDSRCPTDARCITAGNATVEIELMGTATRPIKYKLTTGDLRNGMTKSAVFNGFTISLENLQPQNTTKTGSEKFNGHYQADISVK